MTVRVLHVVTSMNRGGLEVWLGAARPCVSAGAGRVYVALGAFVLEPGDSDAFAISWSALLDPLVLPPPGVVGAGAIRAGKPPEMGLDGELGAARSRAWLACAALLAVVVAWAWSAGLGASRGRSGMLA